MATYAFIDVSQKQEFIYKHNKLRDNLYNSFIIKCVTEELPEPPEKLISLSRHLTRHFSEQVEFVYSGGGNSIVRFATKEQAEHFVRTYSGRVLRDYPDLELYISLVDDDEDEVVSVCGGIDGIKEKKIRELLHEKADKLKDKRRAKFRRWTYGVEKIDETGQAKRCDVKQDRDYDLSKQYLFRSLKKKLESNNEANTPSAPIEITDELQDYRKGEDGKSYIGVIAIDGNKMGEMVSKITTFKELKRFSEAINNLYSQAVSNALLTHAASAYSADTEGKLQKILVTPIVMAGDDICLIVEAEHAIELAKTIVENIKKLSLEKNRDREVLHELMDRDQQGEGLTACAGVAIVKYNYPFFEAVRTAEALCHRAKESMHKVRTEDGKAANASFIDWEIVQGQVDSDHTYEDYVRHGQYEERFHLKPLRIDQEEAAQDGVYSYGAFIRLVQKINEGQKEDKVAQKEKAISSSILEKIKRVIYSGWEQYELFFETNQTEGCERIVQIVQETFGEANSEYAALVAENEQSRVYTYVLNDVLDALSFIKTGQGEEVNVTSE